MAAGLAGSSRGAPIKIDQIINKIMDGSEVGTIFHPSQKPLTAKKQWLANYSKSDGSVILDNGAVKAINSNGNSLLAVGIIKVNKTN